jgi:hypothetical protein
MLVRHAGTVRGTRPTRRAGRAGRLRLVPAVAVCVLFAGVAGCSGSGAHGDDGRPVRSAHGRPILSPDAARHVVAHYNTVNNTANRKRSESLAATIESGSVLERTEASYEVFPTLPPEQQRELEKPFAYTKVRTYIPDHGDWFAATARTNESHTPRLLVFRRKAHAGGDVDAWRLAALVGLEERMPRIDTGRRGAVTTAGSRTRSGSLAPEQLAAAFTDLYATGGSKAGADLDRGAKPVRRALRIHRERDDGLSDLGVAVARKTFSEAEPAHPAIFALRTANGGVLAVAPAAHTVRIEARRGGVRISPSSAEAAYNGSARAMVTDEQSGQLAAVLPPSGKPRVLGAAYTLIGSR